MTSSPQSRFRFSRTSGVVAVSATMLVVGVGGGAVAAATIGTDDIRNNAVTSDKIANETIRSVDIADGKILPRDLAPAARGTKGEKGDPGEPGAGSRWVLVNGDGTIAAQSGGFEVKSRYDAVEGTPAGAVGNVYIDANEDLSDNAVSASLAMQNQVDQNDDSLKNGRSDAPDGNPEFSGEITASVCAITGVIACAPTGTDTREHFVVSPRLSDGGFTTADTRKRFYVVITGDSSDVNTDAAAIPAVALAGAPS